MRRLDHHITILCALGLLKVNRDWRRGVALWHLVVGPVRHRCLGVQDRDPPTYKIGDKRLAQRYGDRDAMPCHAMITHNFECFSELEYLRTAQESETGN